MKPDFIYPCPACKTENQLIEERLFGICMTCGWEDEPEQYNNPDYDDEGANPMSLNEARKMWENGETLYPEFPNNKQLES